MQNTESEEPLFSRSPTVSVSPEVDSHARTNTSRIVNRLGVVKHEVVADAVGRDRSTITKWQSSGEFDRVGLMLSVLGLKVVPIDWQLVDMEQVEAMLTLTKAHINNITSASQLITGEA